jgi:hypothetical protein
LNQKTTFGKGWAKLQPLRKVGPNIKKRFEMNERINYKKKENKVAILYF